MKTSVNIKRTSQVIVDNPNYHQVHHFLNRKIGKANKCENPNCINKNPKIFHWALRKGFKYEEKVENFMMLCVPCHVKYDATENTRLKISISRNKKPVIQRNKNKQIVCEFTSLCEAANITKISKSNILYTIKGIRKSAGGFLWSYK